MTDDLEPVLEQLPEPAPPSSLTATVMARIAREAEVTAAVAPVKTRRELRPWIWTFAGIGLVVALFVNGWLSIGALPDFTSARIGLGRATLVPIEGPTVWLVGLGLLIYLAGLFAPLRDRRR